mmetsp:Transcript_24676/g.18681  ORF Transcript_24676/g.18681 Transcript_24676/m.18681 type:complete len:80 (-) Transcript_24676:49-288(-)
MQIFKVELCQLLQVHNLMIVKKKRNLKGKSLSIRKIAETINDLRLVIKNKKFTFVALERSLLSLSMNIELLQKVINRKT